MHLKTAVDALSNEYGTVKSRFAYQSLPDTCNLVDFPNETQKVEEYGYTNCRLT